MADLSTSIVNAPPLINNPSLFTTSITRLFQQIANLFASINGTGQVSLFASKNANFGQWLLCNGQAISRIDYQVLFSVIGIEYGSGDGITTFNVPNLPASNAVNYFIYFNA